MNNIAIITARSGSKGLPDKNIMPLCGKPMIAYSIEAALDSGLFSTVMVSTDSEGYAEISRSCGAEVPFLRGDELASDTASSWDVVLDVLDNYEKRGKRFDTFCLLQPTSPMRTSDDIIEAYRIYNDNNAFSVVAVTELEHPIAWCGTLKEGGSLDGFMERNRGGRRQVQEKAYRPNGALYIVDVQDFRKDHFLYRKGAYAYIMPQERSVDIDTEFDYEFVEFLMRKKQNV